MESRIKSTDIDEILAISTLINSTLEINEVLKRIMDSANRVVEAEASSLLLIDEATESLYFQVALGDKGDQVKKFTLKIGEGIAGWVAKHSKPLLVSVIFGGSPGSTVKTPALLITELMTLLARSV